MGIPETRSNRYYLRDEKGIKLTLETRCEVDQISCLESWFSRASICHPSDRGSRRGGREAVSRLEWFRCHKDQIETILDFMSKLESLYSPRKVGEILDSINERRRLAGNHSRPIGGNAAFWMFEASQQFYSCVEGLCLRLFPHPLV